MRNLLFISMGAFALSAPHAVWAQLEHSAVQHVEPSSEHLEASYRLLDSANYSEQAKSLIAPMGLMGFNEALEQSANRKGVTLDDELKLVLREAFVEELEKITDEFVNDTRIEAGFVYSQYYTIEEINRLIEINRDPVMVKSAKIAGSLQQELAQIGLENMRKYQPQMEQRMKEITEQYLAEILAEEKS